MKRLFMLSLLFVTGLARAESAAPYMPQVELDEQVDTARVQRAAGAALTVVGAAMAVSSVVMAGYANHNGGVAIDCGNDAACQHNQPLFSASIGLAVTASVLVGVGIPLWVVGSERIKKLEKRAHVSGFFSKSGGGGAVQVLF